MKVKNIVFSGVMGAILMGATGANAAINVASQGYVDSKVGAVSTAVTDLSTSVSNTYQTKEDAATAAADVQTALDAKADKATTLAGYGITDAYTKTETDGLVGAKVSQADYDAHLTAQAAIDKKQTEDIASNLGKINALDEASGGNITGIVTRLDTLEGGTDKVGSVANSIAEALKDYSTTEQVDAKDAATLQSAKDYADGLAGNYDAAGSAAAAKTEAISTANQYTDTKLGDYTKTSELDAGFVTEDEMTTFKSANTGAIADAKKAGTDAAAAAATAQAQADKGVADAATAKSAADAAQADADANAVSISQLQTDLATKITAPAACEKQDCVLSINKASGTISWVPLTEPVADYL